MRDRIVRHAGIDRLVHWISAASVLALLATGFLPILGVEFAWVTIHWSVGLLLIVAVLFHIVRSLLKKRLSTVLIGPRDLKDAVAVAQYSFRISRAAPAKPGKYSFAQKLIHLGFALVVLAACITGAMMTVKIDTPLWERNPYWLSDETWGLVYVIHGFSALALITMVMAHVYFALRPEKAMFLRSMIAGWITRGEFEKAHDPDRWQVNE